MMFGEPIAVIAEAVRETRQIERMTQSPGPGTGRGHRRQIKDGKRDHPASLRMVASTTLSARWRGQRQSRDVGHWIPFRSADAAEGLDCAAGRTFFATRCRLICTRLTGWEAWAVPSGHV